MVGRFGGPVSLIQSSIAFLSGAKVQNQNEDHCDNTDD
jgi:hypothetical protein